MSQFPLSLHCFLKALPTPAAIHLTWTPDKPQKEALMHHFLSFCHFSEGPLIDAASGLYNHLLHIQQAQLVVRGLKVMYTACNDVQANIAWMSPE